MTGREAPLTGEPQPVDNSTTGRSTTAATLDDWIAAVYRQWLERNNREMYLFAGPRAREHDAIRFAVMCLTSPNHRDVLARLNSHATERALRETRPQNLADLAVPDLSDEERDAMMETLDGI